MDHGHLEALIRQHPAWRLLRADTAPLVLSFLGQVFVEENARSVPRVELVARLDDALYALREVSGPGAYPRPAAEYLEAWAAPENGWLRKYYPAGGDEPVYDATPAVERAVGWVRSLQPSPFVGTESRLNTVVELLRQMAFGAEADPQVRLEDLHRRRRELHEEIERVSSGRVDVLDPTAQRDRYQQFALTARELLADFRQVEENFRRLDREVREKIATWSGPKAGLLDEVLGDRSSITDSDQGRSFGAFYDFLLSSARQEEFADLLARVQALPELEHPDARLRHVHHDWLDAAERTQGTVRMLSEQLRRFLDDQVWLENRRVMDLLRGIERSALAVRDSGPVRLEMEVDGTAVSITLPMERPLYTPRRPLVLASEDIEAATEAADASLLYEQVHVDPAPLAGAVRGALLDRPTTTLVDVLASRPLEQGLAELVTYFALREPDLDAVVVEDVHDCVRWQDGAGGEREARVPRLVWSRAGAAGAGGPW